MGRGVDLYLGGIVVAALTGIMLLFNCIALATNAWLSASFSSPDRTLKLGLFEYCTNSQCSECMSIDCVLFFSSHR